MALYAEEEDFWKCPKHPSKRRRNGICPMCLRDRLIALCPDCANVRPCNCYASASSSSSSSSSFSRFSADSFHGTTGRVSSLIDSEPSFRRSRSVAIPFLSSRFVGEKDYVFGSRNDSLATSRSEATSFWSIFKVRKSKKEEGGVELRTKEEVKIVEEAARTRRTMMIRSRSVAGPITGPGDLPPRTKGHGWYFPSPMKFFRHSRISKVVQERQSPLYRG